MSILTIENLYHSYGDKVLYKNASLVMNKGEHIGLLGLNGVGKTTLMNIITGKVICDQGKIQWHPKVKAGYLDQHADIDPAYTIEDYLKTAFAYLYEINDKLLETNDLLNKNTSDHVQLAAKAANLQRNLEEGGFFQINSMIGRVSKGLGLHHIGLNRTIGTLSGGQRAKVILAKLLLENPDVLLLDEPTNFLDKAHIAWLSKFLNSYEGSFIMISHDADFISKTVNVIYDIEFQTLTRYKGNYEFFLSQKGERREQYIKQYKSQQKFIQKTEEYIQKNKARASTAKMAQSRQKMLDKIDRLDSLKTPQKPSFSFIYKPLITETILQTHELEIGYYYPLLPKINLSLKNKKRLNITGSNGIGKSTLLKTITGVIPALSGSYSIGENVIIGYYEQDTDWDDTLTPFRYIANAYPKMTDKEIRTALSKCAVKTEHQMQSLKTLSGGEQSKVKLCKLTLFPCNLLVLDEPTNHMDKDAKEALITALKKFEGTVILVSHEESFAENFADTVFNIDDLFNLGYKKT